MKYIRAWIAAALSAAAVVEFVFWGGAGVGMTLLFLTLAAAYYIACGFPRGGKTRMAEHIVLLVTTTLLAVTYSLFANQALRILNFPVLALLLGILNAFIRPIVMFLALPLLFVTLGLFMLVINAGMLYLVGLILGSHFEVHGFGAAFLGALIISVISTVLNVLTGTNRSSIRVKKTPRKPESRQDVIDI